MKTDKVFIGGYVDAGLKRRFLRELHKANRGVGAKRVSQSGFLELLLLESVKIRKRRKRSGKPASGPKA
jgi:hypothetical protein